MDVNKQMEKYHTQYGDLLQDGLSSGGSYLKLCSENGISMAIRPHADRVQNKVAFVVKLRIAHEGLEAAGADPLLSFTSIPEELWKSVGKQRVSTVIGQVFAATPYQRKELEEQIDLKKMAQSLVQSIEQMSGRTVENKLRVYNAVAMFWSIAMEFMFAKEVDEVGPTKNGDVIDLAEFKKKQEEELASEE